MRTKGSLVQRELSAKLTEGLCGEMFPIRLNYGEYATSYRGNPSVTSVRTGDTSLCTREALGAPAP